MKREKKRYFFTGLLIVLPVLITIYLFITLFIFFDNIIGRYISRYISIWTLENFDFAVPGLVGLLLFVILIFVTGFFAHNFIGRTVFKYFEKLWVKFPGIRSVYPSVKQIVAFLFSPKLQNKLQNVVLVEYPRKGVYTLAFATNESCEAIKHKTGNQDLVNVLVPSVPSPLTGFLIAVPRQDIIFLDLSIEDAIKIIVSGGVLDPKDSMESSNYIT